MGWKDGEREGRVMGVGLEGGEFGEGWEEEGYDWVGRVGGGGGR